MKKHGNDGCSLIETLLCFSMRVYVVPVAEDREGDARVTGERSRLPARNDQRDYSTKVERETENNSRRKQLFKLRMESQMFSVSTLIVR